MALARTSLGVFAKSQFFLPITIGLIKRSLRLLSISNRPSYKKTTNISHWFKQYPTAFPTAEEYKIE